MKDPITVDVSEQALFLVKFRFLSQSMSASLKCDIL